MTTADMSLEQHKLLDEALRGQVTALQRLLLASYDRLTSFLTPRIPEKLRTVCDVEDILQITFVQVYQDFPEFRGKTTAEFSAWLRTIAEAKLVDAMRAANRKKRGGEFNQVTDAPADFSRSYLNLLEQLDGQNRSPSQSIAARDAIEAMQIAIAGLPEDHREAIILRYIRNLSLAEVANQLDKSEDAIRGLLHRAKSTLKVILGNSSAWFTKLE